MSHPKSLFHCCLPSSISSWKELSLGHGVCHLCVPHHLLLNPNRDKYLIHEGRGPYVNLHLVIEGSAEGALVKVQGGGREEENRGLC